MVGGSARVRRGDQQTCQRPRLRRPQLSLMLQSRGIAANAVNDLFCHLRLLRYGLGHGLVVSFGS